MTYAAKGKKVFDWQSPDCTPPLRRSDHRLKKFSSTSDERAWHPCEEIRYRYLYDLMSGSKTCLSTDQCHKYVPLDDLIRILMAEKDELIRKLQERVPGLSESQGDNKNKGKSDNDIENKGKNRIGGVVDGTKDHKSYAQNAQGLSKSGLAGISDTESKELLQNKVAGLTEEVDKSRNMLREAMRKLQNIDEIVNENKKLQCRLRCSEERIKYLEDRKRHLESELANLRSKSQIQMDLEKAQKMLSSVTQRREDSTEMDEVVLQNLTLERDELQDKVTKLEKELEDSKKKETEIEMLKRQSQSDSLEEMSRENECYRKKLASMKCLEKQIQELKKQGRALADKYKREAQKAAEQINKMNQAAKELESLRNERDSLRKRVNELALYECQYNKLQQKLQRVDAVIAENENLNSKLSALQNLEKENEYLRCRLETIQELETTAAEDKERILQLQCAVADQEEEMKALLCQIEMLTSGKHEEELERLKCELYEKNSKLRLCEEQLAEIPMLEAEIDDLRTKLQCRCREIPERKTGESSYQKIEVRLPATSKGIPANYKNPKEKCSSMLGIRREERVDFKSKLDSCMEIIQPQNARANNISSESNKTKDVMSCEEVQSLLQSSKGLISCVLEDMIEHQKEMEELEMCNRAMKEEINALKQKVGGSDKNSLLHEINELKKCLRSKDLEISKLQDQNANAQVSEDIETLRKLNKEMKHELEGVDESQSRLSNKEPSGFKNTSEVFSSESRKVSLKEESDYCKALQREINDLKLQVEALNKLTEELKKENELLRELQQPGPDFSKQLDEKCALENLIALLQSELDAFKGQKLSNECEALRNELKRVMELNCDLKSLVDCYRQRLDLEKKSNELKGEARASESKGVSSLHENILKSNKAESLVQGSEEQGGAMPGEAVPESAGAEGVITVSDIPRSTVTGIKGEIPEDGMSKSLIPGGAVPESAGAERSVTESGVPGSVVTGIKGEIPEDGMSRSLIPGGAVPGSTGAEGAVIETGGIGGARTESGAPGAAGTGSGIPGGAVTRSGIPGGAVTGSGIPGGAVTGSEVPGGAVTGSGIPGGAVTKSGVPKDAVTGSGVPGGAVTKSGVPESAITGSGVRGSAVTGSGVPERVVSGSGAPGSAVTGSGVPESVVSGSGAPGSAVTGSGAPGSAVTGSGVPGRIGTGSSETTRMSPVDCLKELERLRKENSDLIKQLEAGSPSPDSEVGKLQEKLRQMEAENADKLKKLMDQHKKELDKREKTYNENLNAMKSGYETGIRKLSERHKQSVGRLQELHQDEVQEINSNYEAELDTMQTQSEAAINDIAQNSAAKIRKLVADHSKEIGELRDSLTRTSKELESLKEKEKKYNDKVPNNLLKIQQARLMQKMRRTSQQKLSAMKMKFEGETEDLKKKLKEQTKGNGVCECTFAKKRLRKARDPSCPLDFNEVLEKILEEGLDSLTFNEIALVHRKTCCALEGIIMKSNLNPLVDLEPPVNDTCPHTPLLEADKQQLLSRIFALENEILQKQKQTQDAIISMEVAIKKERCRLQEVRNLFESEQQENSKLKFLLSSQTKVQSDLKRERDRLGNEASMHQMLCQERTKQLDEEVKTKKCLEMEIAKLKSDLKQVCAALDAQRGKSSPTQRDQVEHMRVKLEQSIHQDRGLESQFENENKCRIQPQSPVQAMKQSLKHMVKLPAVGNDLGFSQNPLEAKSAKERQNLDQIKEKKNKMKTKCKKQKK